MRVLSSALLTSSDILVGCHTNVVHFIGSLSIMTGAQLSLWAAEDKVHLANVAGACCR